MIKNGKNFICKECGNTFYASLSRIKSGKKYCSKICSHKNTLFNSNTKYWLGKKRPYLFNTNAVKTMFKNNSIPWNKGIEWLAMRGENSPSYKTGEYFDKSKKYFVARRDGKAILKHRYIMQQHLGRILRSDEVVHHINHNKTDNRIENLMIMTPYEHAKHHLTPDVCRFGGYACKGIPKRKAVMPL